MAVALLLLLSTLAGLSGAVAAGAPTPLRTGAAPMTSGPADRAAGLVHVRPSVMLPCSPTIPWPGYATTGDGIPPTPFISDQVGCPLYISQDEVHASFLSNSAGSGDRFTEEVHLPDNGNQTMSYSAVYLSMIVQGDNRSAWNQSLLEVAFFPETDGVGVEISWTVTWAIYSFINGTSGNPQVYNCPGGWNGLAWNDSGWCEGPDGGAVLSQSVGGNSWYNVTFLGVPKTHPVEVWANDSTDSSDSFAFTLNSTTTGTYNFTPDFSIANQTNLLRWGMGFGNGIGVSICPETSAYADCDSYDIYPWTYDPPFEFGIPEFYANGSYSGDFQYLGFESASGDCSYIPGSNLPQPIAICIEPPSSTNYYPYFTFNGSHMDFGTYYPWSTWDFGGPTLQFDVLGSMTAKAPISLDSVGDSSRGGYIAGDTAFNVTARVQEVGHFENGSLIYRIGSGPWTSEKVTQVNGTSSIGYYNASVPATGGNGTISYWLYAQDTAGIATTSNLYTVVRGPLPTFSIEVTTVPSFCGAVVLNGTAYRNGATAYFTPGTYSIGSTGCYAYVNPVFSWTKNLAIHTLLDTITVSGNGSITLTHSFSPPELYVDIVTAPFNCGSITIGGNTYANGGNASVTWNTTYALSSSGCAGEPTFAGYSFEGQFNVTVGTTFQQFLAVGNGTLTVHFLASGDAIPVYFETSPLGCSGLELWGTLYLNGASAGFASGVYPIAPHPCAKYGFLKFATFGGANLTDGGTNVSITSSATLEEINYHLTIITVVTSPSSCGTVEIDGTNYTNGAEVVVANNSTHLAYAFACTGYSLFAFTANGSLSLNGNILTANGSGYLIATFLQGTATEFVGFITNPDYCGEIGFEGATYYDTNFTQVAPGTVATLTATPTCQDLGFLRWVALGPGISIVGNTATINGPGAIEAVFTGLVGLYVYTTPSDCGSVTLNGVTYVDGQAPQFPIGISFPIAATPCAGDDFVAWHSTSGVNISGSTLTLNSAAQISAEFAPIAFDVTILADPATCASISVNRIPADNGTVLPLGAGSYPVKVVPCTGDVVVGYTALGNLTYNGSVLNVSGSGSIEFLLQPVPPIVRLYLPNATAAGGAVTIGATVAAPIPPYNYTYTWSFGDGTMATTAVNFTDHTYASPGVYGVTVSVKDPLGRVATANGTIDVVNAPSSVTATNVVPTILALAAAAVIIGAAYWYTTPRSGAGRGSEESEPEPSPPTLEDGSPPALEEPVPKEP